MQYSDTPVSEPVVTAALRKFRFYIINVALLKFMI